MKKEWFSETAGARLQDYTTEADPLDIILEEDCSSCKEIFYRASKLDPGIGTATVYRLVNKLEEIGAISRKNMYKIACDEENGSREVCKKLRWRIILYGTCHQKTGMK